MKDVTRILHQLPQNIEAEQVVLAAMMNENKYIMQAIEALKMNDFYKEAHQIIYLKIVELFNNDVAVDLVTLSDKLINNELLANVGGLTYLSEIYSRYIKGINFKEYLNIIVNKSTLRLLINELSGLLDDSYNDQDNVDRIIEKAEQKIFNLSKNRNKNQQNDVEQIESIVTRGLFIIENLYKNKGGFIGIPSGFIDIDKMTSGFQKGNMILIAARPSMGKTTLALNICENAAIKYNKKVLFFSLEMAKEELIVKMISSQTSLDMNNIRTGNISDKDWERMGFATGLLSNAPIFIDDTPAISIASIKSKCRRMKIEKGLDLVVIDYLQLMSTGRAIENRVQEVSEISRSIKALAKELECPVIALSQLSRAPEARADHRPILSDLRESGSIEQDADLVMLLYRDEYYNKESDKLNVAECIIAKQRNGETGTISLTWDGKHNRFENLYKV